MDDSRKAGHSGGADDTVDLDADIELASPTPTESDHGSKAGEAQKSDEDSESHEPTQSKEGADIITTDYNADEWQAERIVGSSQDGYCVRYARKPMTWAAFQPFNLAKYHDGYTVLQDGRVLPKWKDLLEPKACISADKLVNEYCIRNRAEEEQRSLAKVKDEGKIRNSVDGKETDVSDEGHYDNSIIDNAEDAEDGNEEGGGDHHDDGDDGGEWREEESAESTTEDKGGEIHVTGDVVEIEGDKDSTGAMRDGNMDRASGNDGAVGDYPMEDDTTADDDGVEDGGVEDGGVEDDGGLDGDKIVTAENGPTTRSYISGATVAMSSKKGKAAEMEDSHDTETRIRSLTGKLLLLKIKVIPGKFWTLYQNFKHRSLPTRCMDGAKTAAAMGSNEPEIAVTTIDEGDEDVQMEDSGSVDENGDSDADSEASTMIIVQE